MSSINLMLVLLCLDSSSPETSLEQRAGSKRTLEEGAGSSLEQGAGSKKTIDQGAGSKRANEQGAGSKEQGESSKRCLEHGVGSKRPRLTGQGLTNSISVGQVESRLIISTNQTLLKLGDLKNENQGRSRSILDLLVENRRNIGFWIDLGIEYGGLE